MPGSPRSSRWSIAATPSRSTTDGARSQRRRSPSLSASPRWLERMTMDLGLEGRLVVITGASKGIGLATAQAFAAEGAHVVAGARESSPELNELNGDGSTTIVEVDLATPEGPGRLVRAAGEHIDVLVNNVGAAPARLDGFLAVDDAMWQATWNLNVMAAVRACRAAIPVMLAGGGGTIVNVASLNAR